MRRVVADRCFHFLLYSGTIACLEREALGKRFCLGSEPPHCRGWKILERLGTGIMALCQPRRAAFSIILRAGKETVEPGDNIIFRMTKG